MRCGRYTRGGAHHPVSGVMKAPGDEASECAGCHLQACFSCITPPNQTWHAHTRLAGAWPHLVPALRSHERRLSREWPLFWPGSRSHTCAPPAKHTLSTAFAATSTPPRKGHLQAHQTAESDAAPRAKASPTIALHESGAGGGGEDRQADIQPPASHPAHTARRRARSGASAPHASPQRRGSAS